MSDKDNALLLWLWLGLNTEPTGKSRQLLLRHFSGRIEDIYGSDDYSDIEGLNDGVKIKLLDKNLDGAYRVIDDCQNEGINIIPPFSPSYPERLKCIKDFPPVLYHIGNPLPPQDRFFCAVVGTRRMTEYGENCAYSISYDMAKAGAVIVSGMADGVDGTAQRACLDAGGFTVAVLGNGLDRCYPADHKMLMAEIAERGCVISEFKPYTKPDRYNFPVRNRVISGISQAVLVVEAPEKSGALNTATHAMSQHRALYAVPGKIGELCNAGTNNLIKEGAKGVTAGVEIIADFEERYSCLNREKIPSVKVTPKTARRRIENAVGEIVRSSEPENNPQVEAPHTIPTEKPVEKVKPVTQKPTEIKKTPRTDILDGTEGDERAVLDTLLCGKSMTQDEIASKSSLGISAVMTAITMLELDGKIIILPGGRYTVE